MGRCCKTSVAICISALEALEEKVISRLPSTPLFLFTQLFFVFGLDFKSK